MPVGSMLTTTYYLFLKVVHDVFGRLTPTVTSRRLRLLVILLEQNSTIPKDHYVTDSFAKSELILVLPLTYQWLI